MLAEPNAILDGFQRTMDDFEISAFTDLLSGVSHTDECEGSHKTRAWFEL